MKKIISLVSCFSFLVSVYAQEIKKENLKKHVEYLASDKLEGRGTSSNGEKTAAEYIKQQFEELKLLPKGSKGYFYDFTFKKSLNPHDTSTADAPVRTGTNVLGYLDNKAPYTVIIGAHFDHLGLGHDGSSLEANSEGMIHNGADDNASGTAGVLELARYFATNKKKEKFNFLFMCFSGEELGLFGSKKYCDNPTVDFSNVNYMINMDMIGRLNDSTKKVVVYGVGTAPDWVPLIDKMKSDFSVKKDSSGIGPSDQTSFYLKNIPVLHFFTGQHSDYHKPSDDADKINYDGEKMVLDYIVSLVKETEKLPKLKFMTTRNPQSDSPRFKVTLGIMPDYTYEDKGVKVDGATQGKPAAIAGVQKGDIIIQLGEIKINSMQDYMKALAEFKKGDSTTVIVKRGTEEIKLPVTL